MRIALIATLTVLSLVFAGDALAGKSGSGGSSKSSGRSTTTASASSRPKVPTATVSKSQHPQAAKHIQDAQRAGHPKVLTVERSATKANRAASMKGVKTKPGKDRDEYPPAMFKEGGKGASVRHIDPKDNRGAGSCIGAQCRKLKDGDKVRIKVVK
jgi:hypothetical protein